MKKSRNEKNRSKKIENRQRQEQAKTGRHYSRKRASLTVEAAMVFPVMLLGLAIGLLVLGWLHDRVVISAHVYSEQAELFFPGRATSMEDCTDQRAWGVVTDHCMLGWTLQEELTGEQYSLRADGPTIGLLQPVVEAQAKRSGMSPMELLRRVEQIELWRKLLGVSSENNTKNNSDD